MTLFCMLQIIFRTIKKFIATSPGLITSFRDGLERYAEPNQPLLVTGVIHPGRHKTIGLNVGLNFELKIGIRSWRGVKHYLRTRPMFYSGLSLASRSSYIVTQQRRKHCSCKLIRNNLFSHSITISNIKFKSNLKKKLTSQSRPLPLVL